VEIAFGSREVPRIEKTCDYKKEKNNKPNCFTIKDHNISTHQSMYWRMKISSCTGIAAYLRTKQYLLMDMT